MALVLALVGLSAWQPARICASSFFITSSIAGAQFCMFLLFLSELGAK